MKTDDLDISQKQQDLEGYQYNILIIVYYTSV